MLEKKDLWSWVGLFGSVPHMFSQITNKWIGVEVDC